MGMDVEKDLLFSFWDLQAQVWGVQQQILCTLLALLWIKMEGQVDWQHQMVPARPDW